MKQITTLSDNAHQSIYFVTEDGIELHLILRFMPRIQCWCLDVESENFNVYGIRLSLNKNILDKFHNEITFGILIDSIDGLDPWKITDFSSGNCSFCVLNEEEKNQVTEYLDGELG